MWNYLDQFDRRACLRAIIITVGFVVIAFPALANRTPHRDYDATEGVPNWLKGRPDLEMRDEFAQLYACMRDRAEEQMLVQLERGSLPDRRLISAINKAAVDWQVTGQPVYEVELRYFDTSGVDPVHLAFRLMGAELQSGNCQ